MSFFITLSLVMTKIMKMNVQVVIFSAILLSMIVVPNSGEASTPEDGDQDEGSEAEPEPEPTAPEEGEEPTAPEEECTPPEVLNPDTNQCEAPQPPPAQECTPPEVLNPDTNQCEAPQPPPAQECTPPEVLNPDTNQCEAPQPPPAQECTPPEVLNPDTNQCEAPQPPPAQECTPPEVLNPDTNQCEAPQPPEPCPEGQVRNPETGECESRLPSIEGNCIAVATSEGINASSAAAASVTCINQEINNVIKQQRVGQATTNPIVQSDNMKLGQTQIDSNNSLVIADFYPFRIVGGHVSSNLPVGNEIQVVIGEIDTTGILSKAVALPLIEAKTLTMNDILYSTQLGSVVQGRDIFTGNVVTINSPSIIMLYNIGEVITFSGANSIAYTAIIN